MSTDSWKLRRVLIVGLGLIGGSFAAALRANHLCEKVSAWVRRPQILQQALESGLIDGGGEDLEALAEEAELIFIAVPPDALHSVLCRLRNVSAHTVLTDAISVKQMVIDQVREVFDGVPENFVPGHPIAGSEQSGIKAAKKDLFLGRKTVLTPIAQTNSQALQLVATLWRGVGATPVEMSADRHDEILAVTSHLPHLLAFAAMDLIRRESEDKGGAKELLSLAGSGLRDFSRIAGSDSALWREIALSNRHQLQKLLQRYSDLLAHMHEQLRDTNGTALEESLARGRDTQHIFADLLTDTRGQ